MRPLARQGSQIAARCGSRGESAGDGCPRAIVLHWGKGRPRPVRARACPSLRGHDTCRTGENQVRGEDYGPDMPARHKSAPYRRAQTAADR